MALRTAPRRLAAVLPRAQSTRLLSTAADPKAKASSLIDSLPGNSIVSKTGWITAGVAASGYAVSKELFVVNEEVIVLAGFVVFAGYIGSIIRAPYTSWADGHISKIRDTLNAARQDHAAAVQERIGSVGELKDAVELTQSLFALSKQTAQLEHDNYVQRQKVELAAEVKTTLDSWVRYESQVREGEQRKLVQQVIANVNKNIADAKFQKDVLADAVQNVEELVKKKAV